MKILVVGSGAREHALCWKLAQEAEVIAAPGNPGIAQLCPCFPVGSDDIGNIVELAQREKIDLVVVGPENPLIAGIADQLRSAGIPTFGPGREGARLEGSKAFAKDLMREAGVPTADFDTFTDPTAAKAFAHDRFANGRQVVVKASGAALGKGAIVCATLGEAEDAIQMMLVDRELGDAGETVVIEDRLIGPEFSLLTLCSDDCCRSLPVAQDYKRALDGDRGPNTGGMGSYSPVPWVSEDMVAETERAVVAPILSALKARGMQFRGVLFSGLIVDGGKPYCLEYNVRFGDPETQSIMPRLGTGFAAALLACALGTTIPAIEVKRNATVSVVLASEGYPGSYERGRPIQLTSNPKNVLVFYAGARNEGEQLVTSGGRVMTVTAEAATRQQARSLVYENLSRITFSGAIYRTDVAI